MELPPNSRRRLSVTANVVEKSLDTLEHLLINPLAGSATHRIEPTYTPAEREALLAGVRDLKLANAAMVDNLHLQPYHVLESQIVNATVNHLWTILVDSRSRAMKGFGYLPSDAAAAIDQHVDELLHLLGTIQDRS